MRVPIIEISLTLRDLSNLVGLDSGDDSESVDRRTMTSATDPNFEDCSALDQTTPFFKFA